jgi:hypothetical protein
MASSLGAVVGLTQALRQPPPAPATGSVPSVG